MIFLCDVRTLLDIPVNVLRDLGVFVWFFKIIMRRGDEVSGSSEQRDKMWDRPGLGTLWWAALGTIQPPSSCVSCALLCSWPAQALQLPGTGFASGIDMSSVQQPVSVFLLPLGCLWFRKPRGCSSIRHTVRGVHTPESCFQMYLLTGAESQV